MNFNNDYRGYNERGGNYNRSYGRQSYQPPKKRSGCTMKESYHSKRTGELIDSPIIYGWNASKKRGLVSFIASPRKDKAKRKTNSKRWENWSVKLTYDNGRPAEWTIGFFDVTSKRIVMPEIKMIANPSKNYWGTFIKRK